LKFEKQLGGYSVIAIVLLFFTIQEENTKDTRAELRLKEIN
tara:strand:- start:483 stop:605 length:123 start_codon:yes stop_codon:yes gene_type:complete